MRLLIAAALSAAVVTPATAATYSPDYIAIEKCAATYRRLSQIDGEALDGYPGKPPVWEKKTQAAVARLKATGEEPDEGEMWIGIGYANLIYEDAILAGTIKTPDIVKTANACTAKWKF